MRLYEYLSGLIVIIFVFSFSSHVRSEVLQSGIVTTEIAPFNNSRLNHDFPEINDDGAVYTPIHYRAHFQAERSLYNYFPRFEPGYVSFSPEGKAYLEYGSFIIETLDNEGKWIYHNLMEFIEPFAKNTLGFKTFLVANSGQTNEAVIRFDKDGDAYVACFIEGNNNANTRTGILLHSNDGMKTWTVYRLPYYMLRFEKLDGHNTDCLNRPPVILMSTYFAPCVNYILIPEKNADGTLTIPQPVRIDNNCFPFIYHSGDGNSALTIGNKVYIIYGKQSLLPGHVTEDGAPAFAVTYDIETKKVSDSVLVGFGGIEFNDSHNWPSMTVDSEGIFHVVICGHHNPFTYVYSKKPYSIAEWSEPEKVSAGTSYCSINCDKNNTLYVITRCSREGYEFRITFHRKKAGQAWETEKYLVIPFKAYYHNWLHKVCLDTVRGRLYVTYYAQTGTVCLFKDEYLAYLNIWPDKEKSFMEQLDGALPSGTYKNGSAPDRHYEHYLTTYSEMCILVSDDGGDTWRIALTPDFQ